MKPIAVQRSWEKNSRVGRSFWLLSRIGQRFGAFRKGRVKRTEPQRPLSFWGSFSPASKTAMGKWSSANPARSRLRISARVHGVFRATQSGKAISSRAFRFSS